MELIHLIMDLVVPPVLLICTLMFLPLYLIYKFLNTVLRTFTIEDLTGKVVLITGASSGIGEIFAYLVPDRVLIQMVILICIFYQLAYEYAKKGARLALVDIREDKLPKVAETARKLGSPDTINISADVSKSDNCKRFVEETVDYFERLDHLVNNAGIASFFFFEKSTDLSKTLPVMDVNFWGSVYPTQFALPHLKKSKGKILVIASASGWLYAPRISFYGASKAALLNFYDTLRVELGSSVKITIASPGFTRTAMLQGKQFNMKGSIETNKSKTDPVFQSLPLRSASECAKAIVKGVCRGDRHVTDPSWYRIFYVLKVFIPEIVEMYLHIQYTIIPRYKKKKNVAAVNVSATSGI